MIPKRDSNIMLVKAAENVHAISHLLLLNHEEFPNRVVDSSGYIYGGVDKAGYLRKTSGTNKPSLYCFFFFKNHTTFPDSGHMPFPLCVGMEVTGGSVTMGRRKPKVRPLRKIKLNLTSKADG